MPILSEATFERLLNRGHYGIIGNQLLFFSEQLDKFVLTDISENERYAAHDYDLLPENAPFQLINGKLIFMAAPKTIHQRISMDLSIEIGTFIKKNRNGELFHAPTDVKFDEKNIVQPDLLFVSIARKQLIGEKNIQGAPDFIIEILSDSTAQKYYEEKMNLYGQYDVIEYWIVKPTEQSVDVYYNHEHQMHLQQQAGVDDTIKSKAIEGFELEVKRIFFI